MRLLRFAGRCLRLAWLFLAAVVPALLVDAIGLGGAALFVYGAWLIYAPTGFIVAGLFMMAFSILMARPSR